MDVDSSSKSGSPMLPLGIAIFGAVLGAIGLIMSFSNSGKVSKLQTDLAQAQSDLTTAKSEADAASGLSTKLNATADKADQVYSYVQQMATVVKSDEENLKALNDTVTKLSTARTAVATTSKGGAAASHVVAGQGGTVPIAAGETLSILAKKYGVTVKAIEDANPGVDPNHLKIGQEITIPGGKSAGGSAAPTHTATDTSAAPATAVSTGQ